MTVEAIAYLPAAQNVSNAFELHPGTGAGNFSAWMQQELLAVDSKLKTADVQLNKLASGEVQNLHQVMIALEEAQLSFQMLVQIRNRLLESYQEILRMQV